MRPAAGSLGEKLRPAASDLPPLRLFQGSPPVKGVRAEDEECASSCSFGARRGCINRGRLLVGENRRGQQ